MSTVTVVDPATEQEVASYPEHGPEQIEAAVAAADAAFREWRRRPIEERGAVLTALAQTRRDRGQQRAALLDGTAAPLAEGRVGGSHRGLDLLRAVPETFGACLRSAVLPAISAGPAKRMTCQNGKFHGITAKITPIGS